MQLLDLESEEIKLAVSNNSGVDDIAKQIPEDAVRSARTQTNGNTCLDTHRWTHGHMDT